MHGGKSQFIVLTRDRFIVVSQIATGSTFSRSATLFFCLSGSIKLTKRSSQPDSKLLDNCSILVTGAASGIGKAVSLRLARAGATVILLDKDISGLEKVYDHIEENNDPQPAIYPLDLAKANIDRYRELAEVIDTQIGPLHGLINNAGYLGAYSPFEHYDVNLYLDVMAVNLHAPFLLTQACLPLLKQAENASILFSTHAHDKAYAGAFGMAKAGMESMMRILAAELDGDKRIRVNSIDAGIVDTTMRRANYPGEDHRQLRKPEDVTDAYLHFMSDASIGETGVNLKLDR